MWADMLGSIGLDKTRRHLPYACGVVFENLRRFGLLLLDAALLVDDPLHRP